MKVLVSGASGLIGTALCHSLEESGHSVLRLTREAAPPRDSAFVQWHPSQGRFDDEQLAKIQNLDAVVHLAGENIIGRWTKSKKRRIRVSRIDGTRLLSETLARLRYPPNVLVSASAIGYYGNRGNEPLREDAVSGRGFLAGVCREWEHATAAAQDAGIRVVHARFGVVLSRHGGALQKMLLPFRFGLGGPIGNGRQYLSWITLHDTVRALEMALRDEKLSGALNVVAPEPLTNKDFARTLGKVLRRPALLPVPALALRLLFGREAADETLLTSQRVLPEKLFVNGFHFRDASPERALLKLLRTPKQ
jgi:uncharacterized protein (TIGR01777 family)